MDDATFAIEKKSEKNITELGQNLKKIKNKFQKHQFAGLLALRHMRR